MNLNFSCQCEDDLDPDQSQDVVREFLHRVGQVRGCGLIEVTSDERIKPTNASARRGFVFGFQLTPECGETIDGQVSVLDEIVAVLVDLSGRHQLRLALGHQMEPLLGRVTQGNAEPGLMDELQTSIRVANSLAEMTLDSSQEDDAAMEDFDRELPEESPEQWSMLLGDGETFQRFPPWEQ